MLNSITSSNRCLNLFELNKYMDQSLQLFQSAWVEPAHKLTRLQFIPTLYSEFIQSFKMEANGVTPIPPPINTEISYLYQSW